MSESKGCALAAVIPVLILTLIVGVGVGAGAVYWYLSNEQAAGPVGATAKEPSDAVPAVDDDRYAVLYPLEQTLTIDGPLPPEEVKEKVLRKRFELRRCYQEGIDENPQLKGEMSLQFTVAGSNGKVTAAVERDTQFSDAAVRECILKEIRSWQFSGDKKSMSVIRFDVLMLSMTASEAAP